jgi:hypothetical protein
VASTDLSPFPCSTAGEHDRGIQGFIDITEGDRKQARSIARDQQIFGHRDYLAR